MSGDERKDGDGERRYSGTGTHSSRPANRPRGTPPGCRWSGDRSVEEGKSVAWDRTGVLREDNPVVPDPGPPRKGSSSSLRGGTPEEKGAGREGCDQTWTGSLVFGRSGQASRHIDRVHRPPVRSRPDTHRPGRPVAGGKRVTGTGVGVSTALRRWKGDEGRDRRSSKVRGLQMYSVYSDRLRVGQGRRTRPKLPGVTSRPYPGTRGLVPVHTLVSEAARVPDVRSLWGRGVVRPRGSKGTYSKQYSRLQVPG